MQEQPKCKIDGCLNGGRLRRGWCPAHYKRWWKTGDAQSSLPPASRATKMGEAQAFFVAAKEFTGTECLVWPFRKSRGYAVLGGNVVSRMVCEAVRGAAPTPKHHAAHSCGNGACVNPRHLSWKTRSENELDKHLHGTALRGEKANGAKLTEADVHLIRKLKGQKRPAEIARMFSVSAPSVRKILIGQSWAWL